MKHKKWLFPILSAVVASVAVVAVWINVESDQGGQKVIKAPKITYVALATQEPSGETVIKAAKITYVSSATEEPEETLVREAHFSFIASSIEELTAEADAVVVGTVSEVAATGIDRGHDGTGSSMAYTLYKFDVAETLKGEVDDSIYIFRYAPDEFPSIPLTTFAVDDVLALYLRVGTTEYAPTITITDTVYSPITLDNGVFDVDVTGAVGVVGDDVVIRPRGIGDDMFAAGTTFTAAEIRNAVKPDSDEEGPVGNTQ